MAFSYLGIDHSVCSSARVRLWPYSSLPPLRARAAELGAAAHHGGPVAGCSPAAALSQRAGDAEIQAHPTQVCCLLGTACCPPSAFVQLTECTCWLSPDGCLLPEIPCEP